MKLLMGLVAAACLISGCATGSGVPHADGAAAVPPSEGPTLCRDGNVPPCNPRGD